MNELTRRRRIMLAESNPWEMLIHNSFNTYVNFKGSNGNTFVIKDDGDWVEIVSNGKNQNTSNITTGTCYKYSDIKYKTCRLTWNIECSDPSAYTTSTGAGNLTLNFYNSATHTGQAGSGRVSKLDYVTLANGLLIGYHSVEFVPNDILSGISQGQYLGWNFGFRSSVNGLVWRILQLDFEVHK